MAQKVSHLLLNHEQIDSDHEYFCQLVLQLKAATNSEFSELFNTLIEHLEKHFHYEQTLMRESRYPGINEHAGEHTRVINELHNFNKRVEVGRLSMAKAYINSTIFDWFNLHINNMDAALVAHLNKINATA